MADIRKRLLRLSAPVGSGCREWCGATLPNGYGKITLGSQADGSRRVCGAHRVAYEEFVGPVPAGMWVLHRCDNPPCIEPMHLFLGTAADNARDRDRKGRHGDIRGSRNGQARLSGELVMAIRVHVSLGVKARRVAEMFSLSEQTVSKIVRGDRWRCVPEAR